jgi:hypothetical protein
MSGAGGGASGGGGQLSFYEQGARYLEELMNKGSVSTDE